MAAAEQTPQKRSFKIVRFFLTTQKRHVFAVMEESAPDKWKMLFFKVGIGKTRKSKIAALEPGDELIEFLKQEKIEEAVFTDANAWTVFLEVVPPIGREERYPTLK